MKHLSGLMQKIINLTSKIETEYPELYKNLEETPINLGNQTQKEITTTDLKNYLETLHRELEEYINSHKGR